MNSIYFCLIFPSVYCVSMIQSYADMIPRRSIEIFYKEQQQQQRIGFAKYVHGNYQSAAWNSSKRLFGRHVCKQNKIVMVPVKNMQSYCKPMYQSYLRRCDKYITGYCTGHRMVYELAYRTVQILMPETQSVYTCCPGWKQTQLSATDCKAAICREPCRNGGMCTRPDRCTCPPGWTGETCETEHEIQTSSEDNAELVRKLESLQQRLSVLEEDWQRNFIIDGSSNRYPRDDNSVMIKSVSKHKALDFGSCCKKNFLSLLPPHR